MLHEVVGMLSTDPHAATSDMPHEQDESSIGRLNIFANRPFDCEWSLHCATPAEEWKTAELPECIAQVQPCMGTFDLFFKQDNQFFQLSIKFVSFSASVLMKWLETSH